MLMSKPKYFGARLLPLACLLLGTGCPSILPQEGDSQGQGGSQSVQGKTALSGGFECVTQDPSLPCKVQRAFYLVRRGGEGLDGLWDGSFDFANQPLYIVDVPEGESPRGYLINPPSVPEGADPITGDSAQGVIAYQYDADAEEASDVQNSLFALFFDIGGNDYTVMLTSDQNEDVPSEFRLNVENDQWIATFTHEAFHGHQIADWADPPGAIQDFENYPLTSETIALAMLELNIVNAALHTNEPGDHERLLKMYVAARTEGMRIDPSTAKLTRNMANAQEHSEGTARYTEVKMFEAFDPDYPKQFHGPQLAPFLDFNADLAEHAGQVFSFGMWYETGAIALRMMDTLKIDFRNALAEGETPFGIAEAHFGMSDAELAEVLSDAQSEFDWDKLQADAGQYAEVVKPMDFGSPPGPGDLPPGDDATQDLLDACEGLTAGDVCSVEAFGQTFAGACTADELGLLCIPDDAGGPGNVP